MILKIKNNLGLFAAGGTGLVALGGTLRKNENYGTIRYGIIRQSLAENFGWKYGV